MLNRFVFAVLVILTSLVAMYVWSHCHETLDCEKPKLHLLGEERWVHGDDNLIDYRINEATPPDHPQPTLESDVNSAASVWHEIDFNGTEVNFRLNHAGSTNAIPGEQGSTDGINTIGWGSLPFIIPAKVYIRKLSNDPDRIRECDMRFNYRKRWAHHVIESPDSHCIKNIATHEFGHFVRLKNVPQGVCDDEYKAYTMYGKTSIGEHKKEDLRCEDEWGAHQMYHVKEWD